MADFPWHYALLFTPAPLICNKEISRWTAERVSWAVLKRFFKESDKDAVIRRWTILWQVWWIGTAIAVAAAVLAPGVRDMLDGIYKG